MSANTRLDDLKRRVQQDPSSIAFAQLAEEYRRAGQLQDAVDVCRAGLAIHPGYVSARVTLGRALLDLQKLEEAQQELERVLKSASENLAAIRGLAEIHHRRGSLSEALTQYRAALSLARNDPDLEQTVMDLAAQLEPAAAVEPDAFEVPDAAREEASPEPVAPKVSMPAGAEIPPAVLWPRPGDNMVAEPPAREIRIVAALEQWLQAIHASGVHRHA